MYMYTNKDQLNRFGLFFAFPGEPPLGPGAHGQRMCRMRARTGDNDNHRHRHIK